jgi:hypothetical protein
MFENFESKIDKSGQCWIWTAAKTKDGYGNYRSKYAHRVSYELYIGAIPEGLIVRHTCDVRHCVNPFHLLVGTKKDNTHDMIMRGRHPIVGKNYCVNGHLKDIGNTRFYNGKRTCKECNKISAQKYRKQRKENAR